MGGRKNHYDLNFPCELAAHVKTTHPANLVFH